MGLIRRKKPRGPAPVLERTLVDDLRDQRTAVANGEPGAVDGLFDLLERVGSESRAMGIPLPETLDSDQVRQRLGQATAYEIPLELLDAGGEDDAAHAVAHLALRAHLLRRREGEDGEADPAQEKLARRADQIWTSVLGWRFPSAWAPVRDAWAGSGQD